MTLLLLRYGLLALFIVALFRAGFYIATNPCVSGQGWHRTLPLWTKILLPASAAGYAAAFIIPALTM